MARAWPLQPPRPAVTVSSRPSQWRQVPCSPGAPAGQMGAVPVHMMGLGSADPQDCIPQISVYTVTREPWRGGRHFRASLPTGPVYPLIFKKKMNKSLCSSSDRLSCARSQDSRHAITMEGKALVTPFGWNIKSESEDRDSLSLSFSGVA